MALWFLFSISLTLYNKWLFVVFGLHFPLCITAMHFSMKVSWRVCWRESRLDET